jgi:cation diffusion facilitator CzcD-associated flavoprotein CzcO
MASNVATGTAPGTRGQPAASEPTELPAHVRVCVVGTGFSGLGMAIRLLRDGERDFIVLERADSVGGTWRDNTYPGCACDVPSQLYSFSFALNGEWSHVFSRQPEIRAYLEQVTDDYGVRPYVHLGTDLETGQWDEAAQVWRLRTNRGEFTADVLVSGCGGLVEPALPDVPGVHSFAGPAFHSARWDHDVDLSGLRVGVVGTGASAIQFIPEIAPIAGEVTVFQRTPPWVIPRRDRAYSAWQRAILRRFPWARRAARAQVYFLREATLLLFRGIWGAKNLRRLAQRQARRHLRSAISDPRLRAALTPDYALGCKRILLSNDYYPTLARPNVRLVTAAVSEIRPHSVIDADGQEHELDVLIFGTGFHVMDIPLGHRLRGRDGRTLNEVWSEQGTQAYRGTTVAGFPNLFLLLGPNTALGHTSVVIMIEAQIEYVGDALAALRRAAATSVDVRPQVQQKYNAALQEQLDDTVWNAGGCRSWYRDESGRNFALWPSHTFTFARQMRRFDPEAYDMRTRAPAST